MTGTEPIRFVDPARSPSGPTPVLDFQDREDELSLLLSGLGGAALWNVYGENGIGKSRLLAELAGRVRAKHAQTIVIPVDLGVLPDDAAACPQALLRAIVSAGGEPLAGLEPDAGQILARLDELAADPLVPAYLVLDSAERLLADKAFLLWCESQLIAPLILAGKVCLLVATRAPVLWRRWEVRSAVHTVQLGPLRADPDPAPARALLRDALCHQLAGPPGAGPEREQFLRTVDQAVDLLAGLSFGHPLLSERLAGRAAAILPDALGDPASFCRTLSAEVVEHFAEDVLEGVDATWQEILRWASVLDGFDSLSLRRYIEHLADQLSPALTSLVVRPDGAGPKPLAEIAGQEDDFYVKGIAALRVQHALVWWDREIGPNGYNVYGVLRHILSRHLQIVYPERFGAACQAAAGVYAYMAGQVPADSDIAQRYRELAAVYVERAGGTVCGAWPQEEDR